LITPCDCTVKAGKKVGPSTWSSCFSPMVRFNTIDPCSIVEEQQLLLNPTVLRLETAAAGKLVCPRTGSVAGAAISMAWPEFVSSGIELGIFWNLWVRFAKRRFDLSGQPNQHRFQRASYPTWLSQPVSGVRSPPGGDVGVRTRLASSLLVDRSVAIPQAYNHLGAHLSSSWWRHGA
jgi:hypothetical protein